MKLEASRRLVEAAADEQLARTYIERYAGIKPGKLLHLGGSQIRFEITPEQFITARKNLIDHFGPIQSNQLYRSIGGLWRLSPTRSISIADRLYGGGSRGAVSSIALFDTEHNESVKDMLRRVLGPIKGNPTKT